VLKQVVLFALNTARYNRGLSFFQWGLTAFGVGIILVGAGLFFSKAKDAQRQPPPMVRWIAITVCGLIGLGIIGYAWLGFTAL
jgi:hypothetical protein